MIKGKYVATIIVDFHIDTDENRLSDSDINGTKQNCTPELKSIVEDYGVGEDGDVTVIEQEFHMYMENENGIKELF